MKLFNTHFEVIFLKIYLESTDNLIIEFKKKCNQKNFCLYNEFKNQIFRYLFSLMDVQYTLHIHEQILYHSVKLWVIIKDCIKCHVKIYCDDSDEHLCRIGFILITLINWCYITYI